MKKFLIALAIALAFMVLAYGYAYYLHVTDPYNQPISPIEEVNNEQI